MMDHYTEYVIIFDRYTNRPLDIFRGDHYIWRGMPAQQFETMVHKLYTPSATYKRLHVYRKSVGLSI